MFGFKLQQEDVESQKKTLQKITKKQEAAAFSPSWDEVWLYGFTPPGGKLKKGILQAKNSPKEMDKLQQVKAAVESGEIPSGVENLKRFTKAHALRLSLLLQEKNRDSYLQSLVDECPENYELITSESQLLRLVDDLEKEMFLSVDTETTGLDYFGKDEVVGICLGLEKKNRFCYIPFGHLVDDFQLEKEKVISALKPYLETAKIKKIFHNYKFDGHFLFNSCQIDVKGLFWDTLSAMTLLNENEPSFALKNLLTTYKEEIGLKEDSKTYEELFGRGGFQFTPLNVARFYGSHDVFGTLRLFRWQESFFQKMPQLHKLLLEVEMPQLLVSLKMERNGMKVDLDFAKQYTEKLKIEVELLEKELVELFGEINWNSPLQIQSLLYEKLGLEDVSGKKSTDRKTLKKLVKQKPELKKVLEYREKQKLLSTYYIPLPRLVGRDGRLRGQFNPHKTVTSRYSSEKPNLQNISPEAREMFVPEKGNIIFGIDLSQIEPRFLSFKSKDENLQKPYVEGWDFYSSVASRAFKKPIEECGDKSVHRQHSKILVLASMYGIHEFSLAESMNLPLQEVKQLMRDFYESNPKMTQFKQETFEEMDRQGFTTTHLGRKRRFPGHVQKAAKLKEMKAEFEQRIGKEVPENIFECKGLSYQEKKTYWTLYKETQRNYRMGFNVRVQGSCAEFLKIAMINIHHYCEENPVFRMIATIHDEILIECPETVTEEQIERFESMMMNAIDLSPVPVKVDTEIFAKSWAQGVSKKEWFSA